MKTFLDCVPCLINQVIGTCRLLKTKEEKIEIITKKVLGKLSNHNFNQPAPLMGAFIHNFIKEELGNPDPFSEYRMMFNSVILEKEEELNKLITDSTDPINTAIRLAIAGNIIDFAVNTEANIDIQQTVDESLQKSFYINAEQELINDLQKASQVLYIGDNCGEIVFDKLLIKELLKINKNITYTVRGEPVLNDATRKDAVQVGIDKLVEVKDNGCAIPGTILKHCSKEFVELFNNSDVIISKGQGNYETLNNSDKNIYFLLKIKCKMIAKDIGGNIGDIILKK